MIEHEYLSNPEKIYTILSEIKTFIMDWASTPIASNIDLQVTQFSDCIIFSFLPNNHYFMTFNFFKQLCIKIIMKHGVIVRGGITYGKIFHNGDFVFGPAMNCAYRLESKEAIYPRIIIDQVALELKNDDGKKVSDYPGQFVLRLADEGYSYIDYIADVNDYVNQLEYYDILKNVISKGLKSEHQGVKAKYEWMRVEYNKARENFTN